MSLLAGWQEFLYLGFLFYPETHIAIKGTLCTAVSVYKKQLNPSWVSKKNLAVSAVCADNPTSVSDIRDVTKGKK